MQTIIIPLYDFNDSWGGYLQWDFWRSVDFEKPEMKESEDLMYVYTILCMLIYILMYIHAYMHICMNEHVCVYTH